MFAARCQLLRRARQLLRWLTRAIPPAMAAGMATARIAPLPHSSPRVARVSYRQQSLRPLTAAPAAVQSVRWTGAYEPANSTVLRQRGAHHRHLAPGVRFMLWANYAWSGTRTSLDFYETTCNQQNQHISGDMDPSCQLLAGDQVLEF